MKIAIMGIRGIPANYGGFETFAEELAPRLVRRGHSVTVYGRSNNIQYREKQYKGVDLVILPTISHKYFDTVIHTFFCVLHAVFKARYDVILFCNAANSLYTFIPRLFGTKVAINVDGIERKRKKWNILGKAWYLSGEIFAVLFPDIVISDAKVIEAYYKKHYGKGTVFIPYGTDTVRLARKDVLDKYGVEPDRYILYVSRLEPENNAHVVIEAFRSVTQDIKLVIVGDAPYSDEYKKRLRALAGDDARIVFTGYVYGEGYKQFQSNALIYVHATDVGGTHPALIEAMGFGNCVIVNGTEENIEVAGGACVIYHKNDAGDLAEKIASLLKDRSTLENFRARAQAHVERTYSWETVTSQYESLFKNLVK